jgi:(1->4)-alpha-D-glucan 1-alpha-D-glucosylmutase
MEDTAFYRFGRLLALNEVGGDPTSGELSMEKFHALQEQRLVTGAGGLTTTATHDTKWGEDARARILALSEIAPEWDIAVKEWHSRNVARFPDNNARGVPTKVHEYMIYQTLVGAWPGAVSSDFVTRMQAYAIKAAREGKQATSWTNPNQTYEAALTDFVARILDPDISAGFLASFEKFAQRTTLLGALNSLSQLTLKTTLPGVPDFYQGTELWDLSLVDPDNRRPVDFCQHVKLLSERGASWAELASEWRGGRIKFEVMNRLLQLRGNQKELFQEGNYRPIVVSGPHRQHVIAFSRKWEAHQIIVAVGRHFGPITRGGLEWPSGWQADLLLPTGTYRSAFGSPGGRWADTAAISDLFDPIPLAILLRG